ncbi:hypothetical protein DU53_07445 [Kosmotoga sp. DU53]|uniref:Uncharacterized protein n=1 Tax=Kosmotoga olearia (strain ATCC BAA-1733 / DSM 21960 / TBF 19.5.1) TaxID=521045 RepID=C5CDN2_KOSOT|nr:hypothetical protein Kole_1350 [Kosmotoga olearia TBF 19.5.1]OAA20483.1 hypothetical protein DU53_07445 [Kosmotoga sp. DU53]
MKAEKPRVQDACGAMRCFAAAMRNFVAAKYLLESNDEILNRVQNDNQKTGHSMLCPVFYVSDVENGDCPIVDCPHFHLFFCC